jgi:hypothetical protein
MKKFMFALTLLCSLAIAAVSADCGRPTAEQLAHSSETGSQNAGEVTSLRGKVLYPDGTKAELIIVEVYRNELAAPVPELTSAQVEEIIRGGRIAAVETATSGKFCFRNLKPGNYLLRANTSRAGGSLSQFVMMNIFVTLAPRGAKGVRRELTVQLEMAI